MEHKLTETDRALVRLAVTLAAIAMVVATLKEEHE